MKDITVIYKRGAVGLARQLFGHRPADDDLARLAGAMDGATVIVSANRKKNWLYLFVSDPRFDRYETSVRRDADSRLFAYIHHVYVAAGHTGQGYGLRAFLRQVNGARRLGLKRFELFAAGYSGSDDEIGYYVWARYGFDARLRDEEQATLPAPLKGSTNLNQLILSGGRAWWKRFGNARSMSFDLADGSEMMNVFRSYLKEQGITEE